MLSNWISYITGGESSESLPEPSNQEETSQQQDNSWIWVDVVHDFLQQGDGLLLDKEIDDSTCTGLGTSAKYSDVLKLANKRDVSKRKRRLRLKLLKSKSDEYIMEKYRFENVLSFRRSLSKIPPSRSLEVANYVQEYREHQHLPNINREIDHVYPQMPRCLNIVDGEDDPWESVSMHNNRKRRRNAFNCKVARLAVDVSADKTLLRLFPHSVYTGEDFDRYLIDSCSEVPDREFPDNQQQICFEARMYKYNGCNRSFRQKRRRKHRWIPYKRHNMKQFSPYNQSDGDINKQLVLRQPMEVDVMRPYNFCNLSIPADIYFEKRNPFSLVLTEDVEYLPVYPLSQLYEFLAFVITQMADITARAASVEIMSGLSYPRCGIFEIECDEDIDSEWDIPRKETRVTHKYRVFRNDFRRSNKDIKNTPFLRINKKSCRMFNKTALRLCRRISKKAMHQMKYY